MKVSFDYHRWRGLLITVGIIWILSCAYIMTPYVMADNGEDDDASAGCGCCGMFLTMIMTSVVLIILAIVVPLIIGLLLLALIVYIIVRVAKHAWKD